MVVVTWMHPQVKIDGDLVLATKWGVNRMLVNVVSLALPGLHWVVVVALKQSVLRDVNERLQVVSFVVRRRPLVAGRWSLACRCQDGVVDRFVGRSGRVPSLWWVSSLPPPRAWRRRRLL